MEDAQHDDIRAPELVANLVVSGQHTPDFPRPESGQAFPQSRLTRDALDPPHDEANGLRRRGGINRIEEGVQPLQIPIGG